MSPKSWSLAGRVVGQPLCAVPHWLHRVVTAVPSRHPLPAAPDRRGRFPVPACSAQCLSRSIRSFARSTVRARIYARRGRGVRNASTLADWVGKSAALLEPLADAIGRHVVPALRSMADDTRSTLLAPGNGKDSKDGPGLVYARDETPVGVEVAASRVLYKFR